MSSPQRKSQIYIVFMLVMYLINEVNNSIFSCSRVRYRHPIFRPFIRLSTFMSKFDIYVKVSILINYKTKQPSNLAWNISLTSWLCDIGVRFSIRLSVCQHLCRSLTFMSKLVFLSTTRLNHQNLHETSPCPPDFASTVPAFPFVCLSVCPSANSSIMSKFDIYVKVSILINYKSKQPSNLAWNIS